MSLFLIVITIIILLFGFVVFFGAPYLPTLSRQTEAALDLIDLQPGQTLLELGCGDGRVVVAAARRGLRVVGYELNPVLVLICKLKTLKYRGKVRIVWGNFWHKKWPTTDGVFVFLLDKYMVKLDKKIIQNNHGKRIKLVSFAFKIPGKRVVAEKEGVRLYSYN